MSDRREIPRYHGGAPIDLGKGAAPGATPFPTTAQEPEHLGYRLALIRLEVQSFTRKSRHVHFGVAAAGFCPFLFPVDIESAPRPFNTTHPAKIESLKKTVTPLNNIVCADYK